MSEVANVLNSELLIKRFSEIAPAGLTYQAEKSFAVQILRNNDWLNKVATGNPASLLAAVANVASIGLSLNPAKKEAYLIARNIKTGKNSWEQRIFLEPSYIGLLALTVQSGCIAWIQAKPVYSSDHYESTGPDSKPMHTHDPFAGKDKRGDFIGVYCTAKTSTGDYLTTEMSAEQVYSIRDRSEAWKKNQSGPWKTDFIEMAKKSVVRNAFKMLPKSGMEKVEQAVHLSNENEGFEPIQTSPELKSYTTETKSYFDQMIEKSDASGMYVLRCTMDEAMFTNLYHSFNKGEKGKYQRVVNELIEKGQVVFTQCLESLTELIEASDEHGVIELLEAMSHEEIEMMKEKLTPEQNLELQQIIRENAA